MDPRPRMCACCAHICVRCPARPSAGGYQRAAARGKRRGRQRGNGQPGAPLFPRAALDDPVLARALGIAHRESTSDEPTLAETSMLVAFRRLIARHGAWDGRTEPAEGAGSRRRVSLYEQVIEDNLGEDLDLRRLADAAGVTRFQVIRDFRKAADLTPAAFIRDRRVRRASLLIERGLRLADAAVAAGFADQSHLTRAFRAARGITPGAYRRAVGAALS